jgi:DnaJ like chaperone protein
MSIWEKLAAATADVSIGGQIASMLGGSARHDSNDKKVSAGPDNEVPFTVGVIALSAKMTKADGSVAADEVKAFKEAFKVSAAEMKQVAPLFNSAKRDATDFASCAEQLVTVFKGNRKLLEDVLNGLFHIAKADDEVHPEEQQFLEKVAKLFGFGDSEFNSINARHVVAAKRNPYDVLGVKRSISDRASVARR